MKPKSTGWRSTNSHWFGHVTDLAAQYNAKYGTRFDKSGFAHFLRVEMAEDDEWPGDVVTTRKGTPMFYPLAWSEADAALANKAVDYCHAVADREGFWLREYGSLGVVEKQWYGRPKP